MHKILLQTLRDNYLDTCFLGSVFFADKNKIIKSVGESADNICFMRSLFKPIQTSILFDCDIIKKYDIKNKEFAIFSGSHAGSDKHINLLKDIMKKHKLKLKDLLIEPIEPLDKRNFKGKPSKLHNNCSAKHIMMLLMCKYMGFNYDYTNPENPLQKLIKAKQEELSGYRSDILTFDGCSTPLWGLPYKNIIKAFYNLIHQYPKLINAIIKYPDIYGGYNRLDTEIIKLGSGRLFSKVGAGGLVLIYNLKEDKTVLIKLAQDNNDVRRLIALDYLNKLNWLNYKVDKNLYNQKGKAVARYEFTL